MRAGRRNALVLSCSAHGTRRPIVSRPFRRVWAGAPRDSTQVKAFRFMGCAPRRPFRLTATAKDNARSRLRGENPSSGGAAGTSTSPTPAGVNSTAKRPPSSSGRSGKGEATGSRRGGAESDSDGGGVVLGLASEVFGEEGLGVAGDWEAAAEAAVAAAARGEGEGDGSRGRKSERKRLACGMCGAMRTPEDVSFRMTAKMVRETLFHVSVSEKSFELGFTSTFTVVGFR